MRSNPKPAIRHSRKFILTQQAIERLDEALRKWWENAEERLLDKEGKPRANPKKLSPVDRAQKLGLDKKTVDSIYRREPHTESTLGAAFKALNVSPPFSIEHDCVSAPPPNVATLCIGRETQVAEIKVLLESKSLVTLTGIGGIGKTRLAIQVADEVKRDYPAGIWYVKLAEEADPSLVLQTVATALGVRENNGRPLLQALTDFVRDKRLLLVLDSCEHLLDACVMLLDHLLSSSSALRVLATSRERLDIPFEKFYRVPPLSVPDPKRLSGEDDVARLLEYDSVRLFVERVRDLRSDFTVTAQNASLVASICHRLAGMPLAIVLAAGRLDAISLDDLERGLLSDFFRLLKGGRAAPPRQKTLRATMDGSYNLLNPKERVLLLRLSVFAGGCRRDVAEQVCAGDEIESDEMLDLLTSLVRKNLVVYQEQEDNARYHLLEPVRQYARDRLAESGESETVQTRHRDYFLALAEEAEPKLAGAEQSEWLKRLEAEHANLRAALEWSVSVVGSSDGLRFCGGLGRFWSTRGYLSEGRMWCTRALATAGGQVQTSERAKVLYWAGILAYYQGDYEPARASFEEGKNLCQKIANPSGLARALIGLGLVASNRGDFAAAHTLYEQSLTLCQEIADRSGMARSLNALGSVAEAQADYAAARSWYQQSVILFREIGDQGSLANSLKNLGSVAQYQGDYAAARPYFEECLALYRQTGDRSGVAYALNGLGLVAQAQGEDRTARSCYEEGLTLCRELGDRSGVAYSLGNLGDVAASQGDYDSARSCYEESLSLYRQTGNRGCIVGSLEAFADLAARENKTERAAVLWGAAAALREEIGSPLSPGKREAYDRAVAEVRQALGEEALSTAWEQGRSLPLEQAIEYSLEAPLS